MRFYIAGAMALLVLSPTRSSIWGAGQEKTMPPQNEAFAMIDFWPLTLLGINDLATPLRLKIVAADGAANETLVKFESMSKSAISVAICVDTALEPAKWHTVREGDRLTFFSRKGEAGKDSPIKEIYLSSDGAYPAELLPTVIASDNVTVTREAKRPEAKKKPPNP